MKIGKDWTIESDSMNVTLSQRHRIRAKEGKPAHDRWEAKGYYSSVQNALIGLVDFGVKETELKEIRLVAKKIEELHTLIKAAPREREIANKAI